MRAVGMGVPEGMQCVQRLLLHGCICLQAALGSVAFIIDMSLLSCHWYAVKAPVTAACICTQACLLV